ncbi:collagen alpha-1(XII) chain-like [Trachinotus anak]|uniref:collagen alpha-1(XII) chain-like n=1 Tax=Trachinotus anak TaxID=443729 RepID=UPI0039F22D29
MLMTEEERTSAAVREETETETDIYLDMDHLLMVLLLLWSSGLHTEGNHNSTGAQCETAKADIVLFVQNTWSMKNFEIVCSFLADIVKVFDIGPDRVQIGLIWYHYTPETVWHLNTHQTKNSLLSAIANLTYREGVNLRPGDLPSCSPVHTRFTLGRDCGIRA